MATLGQISAVFNQGALALAGVAAVSLPIAIHLLTRYRRQIQPWGAMRFLVESFKRQRHRLRLEQLLLLLVRCMAVLLLGLALGGPVLTGCSAWVSSIGGGKQRLIHIAIDDSIAGWAVEADGRRSIDRVKELGLALVDALEPSDRVVVWRLGSLWDQSGYPPESDPAGARRIIHVIEPGYAQSDIPSMLSGIYQSIKDGRNSDLECHLVVLSALARGSVDVDEPITVGMDALGRACGLFVLRPMQLGQNVQVQSLKPARRVVITRSHSALPSLDVDVEVGRFGTQLHKEAYEVELVVVHDGGDKVLFVDKQIQEFGAGQEDGVARFGLPLHKLKGLARRSIDENAPNGISIGLMARVANAPDGQFKDVIDKDNQRWSTIDVRGGLKIGLITDNPAGEISTGYDLSPDRWVRLALSPFDVAGGDQGIRIDRLDPGLVDRQAINHLDAVIVLSPEGVDGGGWSSLGNYAKDGGVAWVVVSPSDRPPFWFDDMRVGFGIDWQLGLEARLADSINQQAWRVEPGGTVPDLMESLSVDWASLLRPIRVNRHFELELRGGLHEVLLETSDGYPITVTSGIGNGSLVLTTAALDLQWTNLPAKPLFVPMLHEMLHGLIGRSSNGSDPDSYVCGQVPAFEDSVDQVLSLSRWSMPDLGQGVGDQVQTPDTSGLGPLVVPGIYTVTPRDRDTFITANPQAAGADTRSVSIETLTDWLGAAGQWVWFNPDEITVMLRRDQAGVDLSRFLLWSVGLIVLLETCLARWFSHSIMPPRVRWSFRQPVGPSQGHDPRGIVT